MNNIYKYMCILCALFVGATMTSCDDDESVDAFEFVNAAIGNYTFSCDGIGVENDVVVVLDNIATGKATVKRINNDLQFQIDGDNDIFQLRNCMNTSDNTCFFFRIADGNSDGTAYSGHNILSAKITNGEEQLYHGYYGIDDKELVFFIESFEDGVSTILQFTAKKK
ncbi:MAG: hypothetical protein MJZ01_00800 [Bacteroidales bacterium]|nr:hypothetical protein [Bacteroidales bacterium]